MTSVKLALAVVGSDDFKIQILQESLLTQLTYQSWPNRHSRILLRGIAVLQAADLKVLEGILRMPSNAAIAC